MVLNPVLVEQRYQEYLVEKSKKDAETAELETQRRALQAATKTRWEATRLAQIHTAEQDYVCECCNKLIPEGTQYRRQNIPVSYGFVSASKNTTRYVARITHVVCSVEAQKP